MIRRLAVLAACSLAAACAAPAAFAHARFLGSSPADGAILDRSPSAVRVLFDDAVRPAGGIAAISNRTRSSVLRGKPATEQGGRRLVVGLRPRLPRGDYTVRWRVRSDDGHTIAGVIAFRVGSGGSRPAAALSADTGLSGLDVLRRWFLVLGIALAAGGLAFDFLVRRPGLRDPGEDDPGLAGTIVVLGFVLALLGLGHLHGTIETRFDRANAIGALAAVAGAALAAVAWVDRRARLLALLPALVLLVVPTLRGHALDPGHSRPLAVVVDVAHLAAASIWIGGIAQLLAAAPASAGVRIETLARRFSTVAVASVAVVGATGVLRALTELTSAGQLWHTGYGLSLVVKTAIFAPLIALGWLNRARIVPALARSAGALTRLRRSLAIEATLLAGLLVAVAVLTALPPGRLAGRSAPTPVQRTKPAALPAGRPGTLVVAREDGEPGVAVAVRCREALLELVAGRRALRPRTLRTTAATHSRADRYAAVNVPIAVALPQPGRSPARPSPGSTAPPRTPRARRVPAARGAGSGGRRRAPPTRR